MSLNRLLLPFVPAEAGTQLLAEFSALDSRFRGMNGGWFNGGANLNSSLSSASFPKFVMTS
jgi:hypothetical protein